jgi:peptide/nickel transport system permease protein
MSSYGRFVLRRLLITIPALVVMSVFVFAIIRLIPGDPVQSMLGFRATPQNVAVIRHDLGLDQPAVQQYFSWVGGILHGDFGQDYVSKVPISELLAQRFPVTLELTVLSLGLALLVGVPLGVLAASGSRWVRRLTDGYVVAGVSIPDFWLGIMLVLLFAAVLGWLPPSGYTPLSESLGDNLRYLALPVLTLAVGESAYLLRTTRGAMEAVLRRPFIRFLEAKGVSRRGIVWRHALRNAAIPIITVTAIQFGVLLGGAIVVESLFALPGVGRMVVTAINQRNYPVVQAGILCVAALFMLVSVLTDLLTGWVDPRIADGQES